MVFYIVKKKKGLHFHLLSNFPTFVQKSGCSLKKKKVFSSQISQLSSKIRVFSKKKKKKKKKGLYFHLLSNFPLSSKNQNVL